MPASSAIPLFSAYGAFIPADQLGVSGVLAVVACGVYLGFRAPEIASPESRMQADGLWSTLTFLLNAALFILIGLQLPVIVGGLSGRPAGEVIGYAAAVCAAVIAVRFLWNFIVTFIIRAVDRRPSQFARRASWRTRVVGSWAGMRGAVSLAAALALPLHTDAGAPLPGRELIQFVTFALILVTVVGQGLTLPFLIRRLGVVEDGTEEQHEELRAQLVIARAALDRVDELEAEDWTRDGTVERVRRLYEFRQRRFKVRAGKIEDDDGIEQGSLLYQRMMHEIYTAQRQALVALRNSRQISSEVMRRVERELDLEESRLEVLSSRPADRAPGGDEGLDRDGVVGRETDRFWRPASSSLATRRRRPPVHAACFVNRSITLSSSKYSRLAGRQGARPRRARAPRS